MSAGISEPILSVRGLKTEFRTEDYTVRAVDGLSYDLEPGKTLAIVGESGSGKSVHALSILGLLPIPPARIVGGEVLFRGKDLLKAKAEEIRKIRGDRIAMIFQEPMTSLNPVMRVGEQIAESVRLHKGLNETDAMNKAAELLMKVGIPDAEKRLRDYPHQFSGGMRQRVMIAIALSCDPDILIADEPTTALDVTIQAQILELMKDLQREYKMALVLITHNIGVVAEMADEVVVMYAGRSVERAPTEELFRTPKHPYTKSLLAAVPSIYSRKERLASIPGQPPDLAKGIVGCPFAPRCSEVMDRCEKEDSPLFTVTETRTARCWNVEEEST